MKDEIFFKKWDDENTMKITFKYGNGSLIEINYKKDSPYKEEMDKLSKLFSNKRLDSLMREVLKSKEFEQQTND